MRFSHSLNRGIFNSTVGSLVNKLHLKKRRDVLFFTQLFLEYQKECDEHNKAEELGEVYKNWVYLVQKELVPEVLKKMPPVMLINKVLKKVWTNTGNMDDIVAKTEGKSIILETKNEGITIRAGENKISKKLFEGVLNALLDREVELIEHIQARTKEEYNRYVFLIKDTPCKKYESKGKSIYFKLNRHDEKSGFKLSDALRNKTFVLRGNGIYFRGDKLTTLENTFFHILGNKNILLERVPEISFNYFNRIIKKSLPEKKMLLLKTLLQTMGWGEIKITKNEEKIKVEIKDPPFGLQKEEDNWDFIINVILGYLWTIDKTLSINKIEKKRKINIVFKSEKEKNHGKNK